MEGQHHSLAAEESRAEFVPSDSDLIQLMDLRDSNEDALLPALTTLEVPKLVGSHRVTLGLARVRCNIISADRSIIRNISRGLQYIFNAFRYSHQTKIDCLMFVLLPAQG